MSITCVFAKFRRLRRRFRLSEEANVATLFALSIIPVIGFTGAAIDYSRASLVRASMQAALDATALAMSKEAATVSSGQLQTDAAAYFAAAFNHPEAQNIKVSATYSNTGGPSVVINGSGSIKTEFMGIMGISNIPFSSSSSTAWGMTRLRVALVLDNTGSMADSGKLTALKSATKSLLTQLQNAVSKPGDVYVSIVPFVKDVNLDSSNYNSSWIDWTAWNAANGSSQTSCTGSGRHQTCTTNWVPNNHNTWNGCVVDRGNSNGPASGNYDTNVVTPITGNTATLFSAEQYSSCPQAVMGLNYNWSSMTTLVNNMSANGNTNQAIGLALGWMSLAGGGPFTVPAMDTNYQYTQVIILLTDGLNTQDRWYTSDTSIDARQKLTCDNIKAAKVTIYAIQVNTGTDPKSSVLQYCASDSTKFYYLTSSNQISGVFTTIGTTLSKLRIAK